MSAAEDKRTGGTARGRMWLSMRILKTFCLPDIIMCSDTDDRKITRRNAEEFIRYLEKIGYIRNTDGKAAHKAVFRLVKNTGPRPVMKRRNGELWDPNLKKAMWSPGGGDER
jgi:hypothetical protein